MSNNEVQYNHSEDTGKIKSIEPIKTRLECGSS